jgi:hypothetical protein
MSTRGRSRRCLRHLASLAFGVTPTAIRILPALCGAATILAAARIAQTLGGGRFAEVLAGVAAACDPVALAAGHLATTTVYDLLGWALVLLFVLRALLAGQELYWLWAGTVAGVDLENKNLILLLAAAVFICDRVLALAAGIALALAAGRNRGRGADLPARAGLAVTARMARDRDVAGPRKRAFRVR